jgi:hypothetical protein
VGILQWELKDVLEWLEVIGFAVYKAQFENVSCNGLKLIGMGKGDMDAMGITNEKHVEAILKQIALLRVGKP